MYRYDVVSKLLHHLILEKSIVGETVFDLERAIYSSKVNDVSEEKHVFISGLARTGTTILMRHLYATNSFCSLTYRDMPFILGPNMWCSFSRHAKPKQGESRERAHGDGILINYDSPEAFEEVFWRVFCGKDYIQKDKLIPMIADHKTIEKFRDFISLILKDRYPKNYLSKNNNNILRLKALKEAFPNSVIIVLFREPLQHAYSLMNQHKRFLLMHNNDPFSKKYMAWLAHYEFGLNHRPFIFSEKNFEGGKVETLEYWLKLWIETYSYLKENNPQGTVFLNYEFLCDNADSVMEWLAKKVQVPSVRHNHSFSKSVKKIDCLVSPEIISRANEVYRDLLACSSS